jgi:hypothetical protein
MCGFLTETGRAGPTAHVDFADNPPSNPGWVSRARFYDAHKLMTENPLKVGVTLDKFEVSVAYPGLEHTYQRFPLWDRRHSWMWVILFEPYTIVQNECAHAHPSLMIDRFISRMAFGS